MRAGATHLERTVVGVPRPVSTVVLTWLAMLAVDLILNAGLLAPLYDWGSPFLLRPDQAFVRIPIGYLSFLVLGIVLVWLLPRLDVKGGREGALVGAAVGAVGWGAFLLGLWSISTADPLLLAGWWVGQTVELGVGGLVVGSMLGGAGRRNVASAVGVLLVAAVLLTIVLQTIGYASAPAPVR